MFRLPRLHPPILPGAPAGTYSSSYSYLYSSSYSYSYGGGEEGAYSYQACYTLTMQDSGGDGWSGNMWHWIDASGSGTTGTLYGGSGTAQLCFTGSGCHTFYVDDSGSWQSEVSWAVMDSAGSITFSVGTVHLSGSNSLLARCCTALTLTPHHTAGWC